MDVFLMGSLYNMMKKIYRKSQDVILRHVEIHPEAKKSLSAKETMAKAEEAIALVDEWARRAGPPQDDQWRSLLEQWRSHLEVHLVAIVLDKKIRKFETMKEAAHEMLLELAKSLDKENVMVPPPHWVVTPATVAKTKQPATAAFRQYDGKGKLVNQVQCLEAMDFHVGCQVIRSDEEALILKLGDDVELDVGGKKMLCSAQSFLDGEWQKKREGKVQTLVNWFQDEPNKNEEFIHHVLKGLVYRSMHEQWENLKPMMKDLQVYQTPRQVLVSGPFRKHQLHISPATMRVQLLPEEKTTPDQLIIGEFDGKMVTLSSTNKVSKSGSGDGFQDPFWLSFVRTSALIGRVLMGCCKHKKIFNHNLS